MATGLLKPGPMTEADLATIAASQGVCRFRYTNVGFPVFLYPATGEGEAIIKLNGKLIPLPSAVEFEHAARPVRVE